MSACACNVSFGNTGKANCEPIQDVAVKYFFTRKYADDGSRNNIPVVTEIDEAYLIARLNDADPSKRWYPSRPLINVVDERGDPTTESIDGVDYIVEEGTRTVEAFSVRTDSVYLGKISTGKCGDFAIYAIDKSNRLIGEISSDETIIYPLAIEGGTFDTRLIKPTQTTIQKTRIAFAYSKLLSDESLRMMEATADLKNAIGLLDVRAEDSAVSTTGFTLDLTLDYGYANNRQIVEGWTDASFAVYNETTEASITPTSVTVTGNSYVFVIPPQTAGDVLTITQTNPDKNGFELIATVTIPV